ncbi:MAG: DUF4197 family protein, partial [Crocinitomicaceae bacterium]|nr:DUF4197 family protein [Crocinitomicaceae bacterium]
MKKKIILPLITITLAFASCEVLNELGIDLPETSTTPAGLSQGEIIEGLKSALTVGAGNSSATASKVDGFMKNSKIKLPFPP